MNRAAFVRAPRTGSGLRPGCMVAADRLGFNLWPRPDRSSTRSIRRLVVDEPLLVVAVGRANFSDWVLVVDAAGRLGWVVARGLVRP